MVDGYPNEKNQLAEARWVTLQYFSAMNIPLVAGRFFSEDDNSSDAHNGNHQSKLCQKVFCQSQPHWRPRQQGG